MWCAVLWPSHKLERKEAIAHSQVKHARMVELVSIRRSGAQAIRK
jgi:hypothetical protein